jgi:hypothetical protein
MRYKYLAVAMALVAGVALTGAGSAAAIPVNHAEAGHTGTHAKASHTGTDAKAGRARSMAVLNPPAHQLTQLDFLLGTFTCITDPVPGTAQRTSTWSTSKILDGNYYQMSIRAPLPGQGTALALWTFGWDSVDLAFVAGYFDNTGTTGTATSAGWQDGHLKFPGGYVYVVTPGGVSGIGKGLHITSQDDLTIVGPGHFHDTTSVLENGQWTPKGGDDCRKVL